MLSVDTRWCLAIDIGLATTCTVHISHIYLIDHPKAYICHKIFSNTSKVNETIDQGQFSTNGKYIATFYIFDYHWQSSIL